MILIQILLIIAILYIVLRFLADPDSSKIRAWKKVLSLLFTIGAVIVVLFPEVANDVAHFVGVSRGADLLLYCLTLAFISSSLSLYIRSKQDQKRMAILVRRVAMLEANNKYANTPKSKNKG